MALRLTGSIDFLTGAITTDQHGIYSGSFSGSGHITSASYADITSTASYVAGANVDGTVSSASYVAGANVDGTVSSASYVAGANVDGTVPSASYALTASHALNGGGGGGGFPYTGSAEITGSFGVTGSAKIKNFVGSGGGGFQNGEWGNYTNYNSLPSSPSGYPFCDVHAATGNDVNKTFVVAGVDTNFNFYQNSYSYNGNIWNQQATLPTTFCNQAPMTGDCDDALTGNDCQNFGGYLSYNGSSNTWQFESTPPNGCCCLPGLVGSPSSGVLQFGGQDFNGNGIQDTYCLSGGVWNTCNSLPTPVYYMLYAGNPSDATSLSGQQNTSPSDVQHHYNWNGNSWSSCNDFGFVRVNSENERQCLTGGTSSTLLYSNIAFQAAYDGTTWSVAPSGGSLMTSPWFNQCSIQSWFLTGDNTCALGYLVNSQDYLGGPNMYGVVSEYCYGTPSVIPSSIWCTPSSPTLNTHGVSEIRFRNGLAGCADAALVYGGQSTNFNQLSSAEFYNGTTWSVTTNGPAIKESMIGGGSADESIWVGGQNFNDCLDHFEYNSGTWSICSFTPFPNPTDLDMGAGSQPNFKTIGCNGHYQWNGSAWNSSIQPNNNACGPSGFGTQNDFLQVGGYTSGFNQTQDTLGYDGVTWNFCNSTPWNTSQGGGAGSSSDGIIYNYANDNAPSLSQAGVSSLAWNGNTWSIDASSNLLPDVGGYTNNSNSALTPDTAMVFGASLNYNLQVGQDPRCSLYFSTYTTNISGGSGPGGVCDVAKFEDGMVVLPLVQTTYDYADDTAAATAGIPLGGLYRSGSFIKIRLT